MKLSNSTIQHIYDEITLQPSFFGFKAQFMPIIILVCHLLKSHALQIFSSIAKVHCHFSQICAKPWVQDPPGEQEGQPSGQLDADKPRYFNPDFDQNSAIISDLKTRLSTQSQTKICSAGIGMGNGWMSPLDQGKYASYLFFHGLLDKAQYQQLDEIGELQKPFYFLSII